MPSIAPSLGEAHPPISDGSSIGVVDASLVPEVPDWKRAVEIHEDPTLAAEFLDRLSHGSGLRSIAVIDLLAARRAFWRLVGPAPPVSAERTASMEAGRRIHRWLGPLLSADGAIEVRVRRNGVTGRIDVLSDLPTEVKTSGTPVPSAELRATRPEHVEQLGMYCVLAGRSRGRLVACVVSEERVTAVHTTEVEFRDLPAIETEMQARADSLRAALTADRADGLPRCPWFGRGCDYQTSQICDCTGAEPEASSRALDAAAEVVPRPDLDARLMDRLASVPPPPSDRGLHRFRELIYPRRAYFDRTSPPSEESEAVGPRSASVDLYGRIAEAVESGPIGEVAGIPLRSEEPLEDVVGFRGLPYLIRTSRAWEPISLAALLDRFPQYVLELGFRCVATGTNSARVVLGSERAEQDRDRLRVLELRFEPSTTFARLWRSRAASLRWAVQVQDPARLPPCPGWMFSDCPYRAVCGCGPEDGRSQR